MAKRAAPVVVPAQLLVADEHPIIAKAKASLAKKFRPTRSAAIDDGVTIAWCLVALGRTREADDLARELATMVAFNGNHSLWSPAADARCLAARLARLGGDAKDARALLAPIIETPAFTGSMPEREFRDWIGQVDKSLADARSEKSRTWARVNAHSALTRACYFRETAPHGFYYAPWVDVAALDTRITEALELLRDKLAGAR